MLEIKTIDTNAADKIRAAIDAGILKSGSWGNGTESVCMMSALVAGADSTNDCVTAGWPKWLASLNVYLFDAKAGAKDEGAERAKFALSVAEAVQKPIDYDKARALFLVKRLTTGKHSATATLDVVKVDSDWWRACKSAVETVSDLLVLEANGEDVKSEIAAARAAAYAAADDAAYAAARAAAYAAADDAAHAAARAAAYASAHASAHASAYDATHAAAYAAARAAARAAAYASAHAASYDAAYDATHAAADASAHASAHASARAAAYDATHAAADAAAYDATHAAAYAAARADLIEALNEAAA